MFNFRLSILELLIFENFRDFWNKKHFRRWVENLKKFAIFQVQVRGSQWRASIALLAFYSDSLMNLVRLSVDWELRRSLLIRKRSLVVASGLTTVERFKIGKVCFQEALSEAETIDGRRFFGLLWCWSLMYFGSLRCFLVLLSAPQCSLMLFGILHCSSVLFTIWLSMSFNEFWWVLMSFNELSFKCR